MRGTELGVRRGRIADQHGLQFDMMDDRPEYLFKCC
jgi:hypothetical protein